MSGANRITGSTFVRRPESPKPASAASPYVPRPVRKGGSAPGPAARGERQGVADGGAARRARRPAEGKMATESGDAPAEGGMNAFPGFLAVRRQSQEKSGDGLAQLDELAAAGQAGMELDHLTGELAPLAGLNGIFEVILPDGETLGVAVNQSDKATAILLTPSSRQLGERLKGKRTELERRLARHIGRDVSLAVL